MRNAAATIKLEYPARYVVEKVAVMRDQNDRSFELVQRAFEPRDGFGVEMVGWLVKQQNIRSFEKKPAQGDPSLLAARKRCHIGAGIRTAQRIHRHFNLGIEIPQSLRFDLVLQRRHLVSRLVGIIGSNFVVSVHEPFLVGHARHDVPQDIL